MLVSLAGLQRTLIATGLKSIGAVARIMDVPNDKPAFKRKVVQQEMTITGTLIVASVLLDKLLGLVKPKYRNNPLVQFFPQALAYVFAEWYSRKATSYSKIYRNELKGAAQKPAQTVDTFSPTPYKPTIARFPEKQIIIGNTTPIKPLPATAIGQQRYYVPMQPYGAWRPSSTMPIAWGTYSR